MNVRYLLYLVLFVVLPGGCSGEKLPADLPKLVSCTLQIKTEDGSPVEQAQVQLIPENSNNAKWSGGGSTDRNGLLDVFTHGKYKGLPEGKYRVVVQKLEKLETGEFKNEKGEMEKLHTGIHALDPVFSKVDTTPLLLDVAAESTAAHILTVRYVKNKKTLP